MQNEMRDVRTAEGEGLVRGEEISWRRLPFAALLAALGAAVINAIVYFAASGLGLIPQSFLVQSSSEEYTLTLVDVAISSVVGAIGAAIVFAIIGLFAKHPVRLFRIVAGLVLVLSLAMPLTFPGAPLSMIVSLMIMHVAAWAVIVGLLTILARREGVS